MTKCDLCFIRRLNRAAFETAYSVPIQTYSGHLVVRRRSLAFGPAAICREPDIAVLNIRVRNAPKDPMGVWLATGTREE